MKPGFSRKPRPTKSVASVERGFQLQLLFDNSNQNVGSDGAPHLHLYRVLAGAQKFLDTQMLLDPLKEQFDLPAVLVKVGNDRRG